MSSLIYMAVPIDQAGGNIPRLIVDLELEWALGEAGFVSFWPSRAFSVGGGAPVSTVIEDANRSVLDVCAGVLALLPAGTPTIGVPREIEAAVGAGLPVAVLSDAHSWSLADVPTFPLTPEGVAEALKELGAGEARQYGVQVVVGANGALPTRAHVTDAGYDLYVSAETVIWPGEFVDVETDIRVAFPPALWGRITGRSSTLRKKSLLVAEGVIDGGYRGPIFAGVWNLGKSATTIRAGERIAQLIPHLNVAVNSPMTEVTAEEFDAIPHDGRGAAGFGSSGR